MTKFLNISTDNTLGGTSPSDNVVASQKAVKDYVDSQGGGGGSVAIDGTTITRNTDNEIQTVAVINGNTASGATNPIYDWVGTVDEYVAQDVATQHPEWLCFITNQNHGNLSHYVVAAQYPNAGNDYTWYFKYSDGWVEQGGKTSTFTNTASGTADNKTITLPITMADNNYSITTTRAGGGSGWSYRELCASNPTTSQFTLEEWTNGTASGTTCYAKWEVKGIAAS